MNPFSACCPDQNSSDFVIYEVTERRVYFECPHCGMIQGIEPVEAFDWYASVVKSMHEMIAMTEPEKRKGDMDDIPY